MPDLKDLDRKLREIDKAGQSGNEAHDVRMRDAENMSTGIRAGAELVGAIMAGGFMGWLLDGWLGTKPLFLIAMLLLGVATGFVNVWRTTQNIGTSPGFSELHRREKPAKTPPDEQES